MTTYIRGCRHGECRTWPRCACGHELQMSAADEAEAIAYAPAYLGRQPEATSPRRAIAEVWDEADHETDDATRFGRGLRVGIIAASVFWLLVGLGLWWWLR